MAQRSSNDLLNDILGTLTYIIHDQRAFQNKILNELKKGRPSSEKAGPSQPGKNDNQAQQTSLNELLIAINKSNGAQQSPKQSADKNVSNFSDIINGIKQLSDIDVKKLDRVSVTIDKIAKSISGIQIDPDKTRGLAEVGNFMSSLSSLNHLSVRAYMMIRLGILDSLARQLNNLAKSVNLTSKQLQNQETLSKFLANVSSMMLILKDVPDKLSKGISQKNAQRISDFFTTLLKDIPDEKVAESKAKSLLLISKAIAQMNVGAMLQLGAASLLIGKRSGRAIYEFVS